MCSYPSLLGPDTIDRSPGPPSGVTPLLFRPSDGGGGLPHTGRFPVDLPSFPTVVPVRFPRSSLDLRVFLGRDPDVMAGGPPRYHDPNSGVYVFGRRPGAPRTGSVVGKGGVERGHVFGQIVGVDTGSASPSWTRVQDTGVGRGSGPTELYTQSGHLVGTSGG